MKKVLILSIIIGIIVGLIDYRGYSWVFSNLFMENPIVDLVSVILAFVGGQWAFSKTFDFFCSRSVS